MINKLLQKLGYIKLDKFRDLDTNPFTEEELSYMLVSLLGDEDDELGEKEEQKIFSEAKKVEGLVEYLRRTATKDVKRYFGVPTPHEQLIIRGSFARTLYLKSKIMSGGVKKVSKMDGIRNT